jgi:hypothetical protein
MMLFADDSPLNLPTALTGGTVAGVILAIGYVAVKFGPLAFRFILDFFKQNISSADERKASDNRFYLDGWNKADTAKSDELRRAYRLLDELQHLNDQYAARLENCRINDAAREAIACQLVENQNRLAKIVTDCGRDPGLLLKMPDRVEIDDDTLKHRALNAAQNVEYAKAISESKAGSKH